jgi:hypothetical protein
MDILLFCRVFALPSPRNAHKRDKTKSRRIMPWGRLVPRKRIKYTQGFVTSFFEFEFECPLVLGDQAIRAAGAAKNNLLQLHAWRT